MLVLSTLISAKDQGDIDGTSVRTNFLLTKSKRWQIAPRAEPASASLRFFLRFPVAKETEAKETEARPEASALAKHPEVVGVRAAQ